MKPLATVSAAGSFGSPTVNLPGLLKLDNAYGSDCSQGRTLLHLQYSFVCFNASTQSHTSHLPLLPNQSLGDLPTLHSSKKF